MTNHYDRDLRAKGGRTIKVRLNPERAAKADKAKPDHLSFNQWVGELIDHAPERR